MRQVSSPLKTSWLYRARALFIFSRRCYYLCLFHYSGYCWSTSELLCWVSSEPLWFLLLTRKSDEHNQYCHWHFLNPEIFRENHLAVSDPKTQDVHWAHLYESPHNLRNLRLDNMQSCTGLQKKYFKSKWAKTKITGGLFSHGQRAEERPKDRWRDSQAEKKTSGQEERKKTQNDFNRESHWRTGYTNTTCHWYTDVSRGTCIANKSHIRWQTGAPAKVVCP